LESIVVDREQIVVGVDTHKWEHVAVAVDGLGRRIGELTIPATPAGYQAMLDWVESVGPVVAFGTTHEDCEGAWAWYIEEGRCGETS
jgi:hypothetical protein